MLEGARDRAASPRVVGLVARPRDRQGHERAVRARSASTCRRPARCSRRARSSSRCSSGIVVTLVAEHRSRRCARRACRRSRRCARARRCRTVAARAAQPVHRGRRGRASSLALLGVRRCSRTASARRRAALARGGVLAAVRRRRAARPAAREAARPVVGAAGRAVGGARRPARPRERDPQPRPHRRDGRRADDRPRAGHVRRHARERAARVEPRRDRGADRRRLRRHVTGRLHAVRRRRGRRGRGGAVRAKSSPTSAPRPARSRPRRYLTGIDPTTIAHFYTFDWVEGSDATLAELDADGALVDTSFADDHDLAVGRPSTLRTGGRRVEHGAVIRASTSRRRSTRCSATSAIPTATFDALVRAPPEPVHVRQRAGGRRRGEQRRRCKRRVARFPDAKVQTREEWIDKEDARVRPVPHDALRAAGLLGDRQPVRHGQHARALGLRAHARARDAARDRHDPPPDAPDDPPRERHHGADRRGARAPARHLPRGARDARAREFDLRFEVPAGQLVFLVALAVVVGLLAAITPARRASRLDPLEALQYE